MDKLYVLVLATVPEKKESITVIAGTTVQQIYGQRCQCEEAQACCDTYIEQNDITNCILCEANFSNPEYLVAPWDYISCADGASRVYIALDEFGREKQCNKAKMEAYQRGCVCPGFIPPGIPMGIPHRNPP